MPPGAEARPHLASYIQDFLRYNRQTAIVHRDGLRWMRTSYGDLAVVAGRFAAELEKRGIAKGDRVVLWGVNGAPWVGAFFGCMLRGVIAVPLDLSGSADFAARVISDVQAKLLAGSAEQIALLAERPPAIAFEEFAATLPQEPKLQPIETLTETDPFQIVFTSGTTGDPKGIVHTHRNVLASLRPIEREMQPYMKYERIFHPLRFLHTLPLSHVFGQFMGMWIPALFAAEVHFESNLVPSSMIDYIRKTRISVLACVPRVLDLIRTYLLQRFPGLEQRISEARGYSVQRRWWEFLDIHRLFGLKFWAFISGGATLAPDLEAFWGALGFAIIQGYGMTETAALVTLNHPFRATRGSIGKVLPGREVQISPEGEILVRGETVSDAVWEQGELRKRQSDWLPTGDLAAVDDNGNLRYRGRKKDVIVTSSGLNIYPEDLESALERQPQIKANAVIEVEGPSGPEPMAVISLRPGVPADQAATAIRAANQALADFQHIRRWAVWSEPDLPRTSTGKVLKRELARVLGRNQAQGAVIAGTTLDRILHRLTNENTAELPDSTRLSDDLHLDSLGRVELLASLEAQFGIQIDEARWAEIETLGDLRALLQDQSVESTPFEANGQPVTPPPAASARHIYPFWTLQAWQSAIRMVYLEVISQPLVWLFTRPKVDRGLHRIPAVPMLIVSNHVTAYDVPLVLYALPRKVRSHVAVAMGAELLRDMRRGEGQGSAFLNLVAPVGYFLITALYNVFPLPQRSGFRESFDYAAAAMDKGYHVLVFPEGRRTKDEHMHEFQNGAGLLWKELRCPAAPVFIEGLAELKVAGRGWFHSGRITIHTGETMELDPSLTPGMETKVLEAAVRNLDRRSESQ